MPLIADLDLARRFVEAHPPPGAVLHVGLVGAHAYGFPSEDSDLDLKGMHIAPTASLLGLSAPPETHDVLTIWEGVEHDLTTHEVGKALALLLRGNGNVLERLTSPLQLFETDDLPTLRSLALGSLSKRFFDHYRGYFGGMCREHAREPRAKSLLYAYRVALTGVHLLRTGEVEMNVEVTADAYGFDVSPLIALKRAGAEKGSLPEALDAEHRAAWPKLEEQLTRARDRSALPDEPPNVDAIEAWLVERRQAAFRTRA
ncbi:MAG: nucleotidyltransferase domain-containing protein [Sandaracinaceae bacterium]